MTTEHADSLLLALYRAARESLPPEFKERVLLLLKSALGFDAAMWGIGEVDGTSGLAFQSVTLHNLPEEMLVEYEQIADHDRVAYEAFSPKALGRTQTFNLRELMPGRRYDDVAAFDRRWGLQNLLSCTARADGVDSAFASVALWRAKESARFSYDERRAASALLPHLLEAGNINRLLWLDRLAQRVDARGNVRAIVNGAGLLVTRDAQFCEMLRKEWRDWLPPILPAVLFKSLAETPERRYVGKGISVTASVVGGMLFVLAREKSRVEGLTPAQFAITRRIVAGLSYKQVARELDISPLTVRNQLHTVYEKLGVGNKAALAQRFSALN